MRAERPAETDDPLRAAAPRRSYARCRRLHRAHGMTYYRATRALPRADQPHVHALYGRCRYADEIVDAPGRGGLVERTAALDALEGRFCEGLVTGHSDHPVLERYTDGSAAVGTEP